MGMLQGGLLSQDAGGVPPSYTLQLGDVGDEIVSEVDAGFGNARIRIYGDLDISGRQGRVYADNNVGSLVQFEASTNWVIPNTDAEEEDWWCRFTNLTGDTGDLTGNGVDTWIDLSAATCAITLNDPSEPEAQFTVLGDVEIRIGTGSPEVVGTIFLGTEAESEEKGK